MDKNLLNDIKNLQFISDCYAGNSELQIARIKIIETIKILKDFSSQKLEFLEELQDKIYQIKELGEIPTLIIINEDDFEKITREHIGVEFTPNSFFGIKVLPVPDYLRDNSFLNDGDALVISENGLEELKRNLRLI